MEKSSIDPLAIEEFKKASLEYLTPLAKEFGFNFEEIDSRLFALISETISVKVYFPECHGYDVDLRVSPIFSSDWYSPQEVSFYWVLQFLGLEEFSTSRRTSIEQIKELVQINEGFLRQALPQLISAKSDFWNELPLFIQAQISKENELDKQWLEEQQLSEVRQKIDVAWKAKNYSKVISLFEEMKGNMTVAEIKKLEYARKHIA